MEKPFSLFEYISPLKALITELYGEDVAPKAMRSKEYGAIWIDNFKAFSELPHGTARKDFAAFLGSLRSIARHIKDDTPLPVFMAVVSGKTAEMREAAFDWGNPKSVALKAYGAIGDYRGVLPGEEPYQDSLYKAAYRHDDDDAKKVLSILGSNRDVSWLRRFEAALREVHSRQELQDREDRLRYGDTRKLDPVRLMGEEWTRS